MSIRTTMQKVDFLSKIKRCARIYSGYFNDARYFSKYNLEAAEKRGQYEYRMMLHVHSLEKGMCAHNPRPFGQAKVLELMKWVRKAKNDGKTGTPYQMSGGIIKEWLSLYEHNGWTKEPAYVKCLDAFTAYRDEPSVNVGSMTIEKQDTDVKRNGDFHQLLESRHSTREYTAQKPSEQDILACIEMTALTPSACNRQMCKIYWVDNEQGRQALQDARLGLVGFNRESMALFVVTYETAALAFYGERNQGYFNAGLTAMNFVNALHYRAIGSFILQWGNKPYRVEKEIKQLLHIPAGEKIAIVIGAGYYTQESTVPCSHRKTTDEIYTHIQ